MKAQPCYLLFEGDDHANASFCESVSEAKSLFQRAAMPAWKIEQYLRATLHYVEARGDDWSQDADARLILSKRGAVVFERC